MATKNEKITSIGVRVVGNGYYIMSKSYEGEDKDGRPTWRDESEVFVDFGKLFKTVQDILQDLKE